MKTDKTKNNGWNEAWCPLFGSIPSCEIWDGISEKCISIIEDARLLWGGFGYLPELYNPEPKRIEKHTGYPAILIEGARFLVNVCGAHEILFDAQFRQALYKNKAGWIQGRNEPYLLIDVDQLNPERLIESITTRAGLPHEFKVALIDDPSKLPDDWDHPIITPAMIFALMSISVAWDIFVNVLDGTMKAKSTETLSQLLTAEKLLKAAHSFQVDASQHHIEQIKKKPMVHGRSGGLISGEKRAADAQARYDSWQELADDLWVKHPSWSKLRIAKKIAEQTHYEAGTIRRQIKKK